MTLYIAILSMSISILRLVSLLFNLHKLKIVLHDHGEVDLKNKNHRFLKTLLNPKFYIGVSQIQIDFLS